VLVVVVPQHDEGPLEAREQHPEQRFPTWTRDKIARDRNEIGLALCDPVDRTLDGHLTA
jgi:hypothetical protein